MDAKSLRAICQIPEHRRFAEIAEGLELLADNAARLDQDARTLGDDGRHQGAGILRGLADEEAAKVLILLDLARVGWNDSAAVAACMRNFYNHLARGLYVRAYFGRPADLAEVREHVDFLRQQYYLDGPMDVDFIFGNEVNAEREGWMYVDYVTDEHGEGHWVSPANRAEIYSEFSSPATPPSAIIEMVAAMRAIGLLTSDGLDAIRATWDGEAVDDSMRWVDLRPMNVEVINKLDASRGGYAELDLPALRTVVNGWIFPMAGLDLKLAKVDRAELQRVRDRQLAREMGGIDDEGGYGYV